MKTLAIHGHSKRGEEVIEVLEMLGGENKADLSGSSLYIYYIDGNNHIDLSSKLQDKFITFHLEEFLEKYPYKVGDLVNTQYYENTEIVKMTWDGNTIMYELHDLGLYTIEELQPYNKIIEKSRCKHKDTVYINLNQCYYDDSNKVELQLPENWKFKQEDDKMFGVRKLYPKTYGECSDILHTSCSRMRNLKDVINEMLDVIPENEIHLINALKDIKNDQIYRAPEDTVGWELVSEELESINLNLDSEYWKFKIFSIFSTMSIEDIKKELTVI